MSLERIVRPFQSGDVFNARTTVPSLPVQPNQISEDVCDLSWTGENPGVYEDFPLDMGLLNINVEWTEDKTQRVTEDVKIEQKDNPENFVVVQRMKSTVLRDSQTGRNFNMKFADWDDH